MTGHINVMLVLQSCTDPLQIMAGSCAEIFPTSSDSTYVVGNMKVEKHMDIKEEEEVNVKTENVIDGEELEFIDIKNEDCIYSEEENVEEEDIDTKGEENVDIIEEVS